MKILWYQKQWTIWSKTEKLQSLLETVRCTTFSHNWLLGYWYELTTAPGMPVVGTLVDGSSPPPRIESQFLLELNLSTASPREPIHEQRDEPFRYRKVTPNRQVMASAWDSIHSGMKMRTLNPSPHVSKNSTLHYVIECFWPPVLSRRVYWTSNYNDREQVSSTFAVTNTKSMPHLFKRATNLQIQGHSITNVYGSRVTAGKFLHAISSETNAPALLSLDVCSTDKLNLTFFRITAQVCTKPSM